MTDTNGDVWDSQLLSENIGFLENCFDNSFSILQSSLCVVKEYLAEENCSQTTSVKPCNLDKKGNDSLHSKPSLNLTNSYEDICLKLRSQVDGGLHKPKNNCLTDWGLPSEIVNKYKTRGITQMFDWQVTCLSNPKVLMDCCNLVYSAPTSAGKTLVAEIITIKTILERQKKVIVILPFVSIVREKMFYLQDILSCSGIRVEGFMGSQTPPGGLNSVHVAICTIEKANSLINRLLDDGSISDLGAVIVDELHLLGDLHRGYILELLLTKIKYISTKLDDTLIQIVGMSATLPNLDVLAHWLDAELFVTQFRPIPLDEYCLVDTKYYNKNGELINSITHKTADRSDCVLKICFDTISEGCSVLIFCMTKNRCENLAQSLSATFYKIGCSGDEMGMILRKQLKTEDISEVLEQLKNCPVGLDHILKSTISFGVAYHHAGLTFDERDIIEGGFKSGAIRVLVATSTLSSGVNLPARKVIVRSPVFQRQPINILTYKQMIGRAGRMGKDSKGESILICTEAEKNIGFNLMMGDLLPVKSCIDNDDKFMRAVLEMIASQIVCTEDDLEVYSKCTLLFNQTDQVESNNNLLSKTLKELINYELVRVQNNDEAKEYVATPLGKACLSSSMAPNDGLSLFCELQKARQCLVLETDLHLIYLVTPYSLCNQWNEIDWLHFLNLWESSTRAMKRVGQLVGIQESFIIRSLRGGNKKENTNIKINVHKRFYIALALQDLVNEVPLSEVASKFQCARGFLQSLQQAAATFAGMVTAFCRQLGWKNMEMLMCQFQDRLHFGINSDLLELMKLQSLNGIRARSLFDSGFETISSIASSDVNKIENALYKAVPFQSEKGMDGDETEDIRKRNKIKNIWITGCCGLTAKEAAEKLIIEARKYLEYEIGTSQIKWDKNNSNDSEKYTKISTTVIAQNEMNYENSNTFEKAESIISPSSKTIEKKYDEVKSGELYKPQSVQSLTSDHESLVLSKVLLKSDQAQNNNSTHNSFKTEFINQSYSPVLIIEQDRRDIEEQEKMSVVSDNNVSIQEKLKDVTNLQQNHKTKDEIVWDSMNFTNVPFECITKTLTNENIFSPNISFGDNDHKTLLNTEQNDKTESKVSSKDISLFSTDGENSSLFEDSLPLDLIPSKLLDTNHCDKLTKLPLNSLMHITTTTNTILNEFQTTCTDFDEEEEMKLHYEEENQLSENDSCIGFNTTIDIDEINTQDLKNVPIKPCYISPFKRHMNHSNDDYVYEHPSKKSKLESKIILIENIPVLKSLSSKMLQLKIRKNIIQCFILRGNDILDNLQILNNFDNIALYLDFQNKMSPCSTVIGSNIFKQTKTIENDVVEKKNKMLTIKSFTFCYKDKCLFLDIASLDVKAISFVKQRLSILFRRQDVKWKYMSLQSIFCPLKQFCDIELPLPWIDISLIDWLIDSEEKTQSLTFLAKKYCEIDLLTDYVWDNGSRKMFKNLESDKEICLKGWLIWHLAEKLNNALLKQYDNVKSTVDIEAQVLKILSISQYNGVTVDKNLASKLLIDVKNSHEILQKKAFKTCGYHFNFNSSNDIAKVLGIYKGRKVSTKKSVLTAHNTAMSSLIIYWRKLNSILTKTLYPLTEKAHIYSVGNRINPSYTMYTCTGRVSMHEPNLQNVPRTFNIPAKYLSLKDNEVSNDVIEFNCRNIFRAADGYVLVSADYCQLEMRILTHYSEDPVLTKIMSSNVDVFKSIAASWGGVPEEEVDDDLRQKAKQLCYGILYGMGNKSLAQHLDVTELEASVFMDTFYKTYPAIRAFKHALIEDCKKKTYVETLTKRRRYLPDINCSILSRRSAAERQAVNTTIQGSAADIAKAAMCAIDNRTQHLPDKPKLFLQMHDELIYEVPKSFEHTFVLIMKEVMEGTVRLKVPLPVKVKVGQSWGALQEIKI